MAMLLCQGIESIIFSYIFQHVYCQTTYTLFMDHSKHLLPTRCEVSGVLGVGSISVAIRPSCQDVTNTAL